jgi:hypothetical protein
MIVEEAIKEFLKYDPETGELIWLVQRGGAQVGDVAGTLTRSRNSGDYLRVGIDGKRYGAHVLAWYLTYGEWPAQQLDHKNGDSCDNRLCNLRLATPVENAKNRGLNVLNTSGVAGVSVIGNGWQAYIAKQYLGYFENFEDAVAARRAAEDRLGYTEAQAERLS